MKNTKKMKNSGIAWLGEIPEGWEFQRAKYLMQKTKGKNPKKIEPFNKDGFLPYVTASSFENYIYENFVNIDEDLPIVKKNESIILWDGARAGFIDFGHFGFLSSTMVSLKPNDTFNNKFFFYFLKSNQKLFQDFANGTTIPHADGELLDNLQIPLPPLPTQNAIADYLDKKTSQITKFIDDKKKMIELLKEQKQAIIYNAVTKGIDKNVKMKNSGIAWLGEIPEGWEVRKLKFLGKIINGSTPLSTERKFWDGDIDWITPTDLGNSDDPKLYKSGRKITKLGLDSCGSTMVPTNSIIISCRAPIGSIGITTKEMCTNQGCKSFIPNNYLNYEFVYNYFVALNEYLQSLGSGTTFQELSTSEFANSFFLLPSTEEQNKIIYYIKKETSRIETAIAKIQKEISLIEEYKKSLIYHAVTGKIAIEAVNDSIN